MDAERWQRVSHIFLAALERTPAERTPFVQGAAQGDEDLCREVEALLASDRAAGAFMAGSALAADTHVPSTVPSSAFAPLGRPNLPRRFGDYELIDEIAQGGMGVVFKARQIPLNRLVAVKTIVGGALASPRMVQRFRTEAEAVASLTHPNIVPIYEVGEHDGQHYFSMRLVEGGNLRDRFADFALPRPPASGGGLPGSSVATRQSGIARLVSTIARAVHHAHQRGVLHRDLKPANILLDANGEPQVTDFGIAKLLVRDGELTESVTVVGTPSYMAPEQASGTAMLTTAADVFSLGGILYHLLTNRVPFEAATPVATLQQVIEHDPPAPRSQNAAIDRDLETICLKCLHKDPRRRYASADALADDLDRWRAGEPIAARSVGQVERAWRWCRRKPLLATLWLGLACAIVVAFVVSTTARRNAERSAATLRANLYAADMAVAFHAWDAGYVLRTRELLDAHRPKPGEADLRTFEWRYLFGLARPRELLTIRSASTQVWGNAISPDGRLLATGGGDGRVQLWELPSGRVRATLQAGSNISYAVAFSPDGRLLATTADTTEILLWDVASGTQVGRLGPQSANVLSVAFSHDGKTLASMSGYPYATEVPAELTLWDVASRSKLRTLVGHRSSSGWMDFSPDDRVLATPHGNGTIVLWDVASGRMLATLAGHEGLVISVRFSPDGRQLVSGGVDGSVRLWDVAERHAAGILGSHQGTVYSVAFSPDGRRAVSGGIDHTAKLWDLGDRHQVTTFRGHLSRIFSVSFAPDGKTFVTGSLDGTARVWDATVAADAALFDRHQGNYAFLRFSADGRWLSRSVPSGRQVTLWDAHSRKKVATLAQESADFSYDGRLLATTSAPDVLAIWDLSTPLVTPRATIRLSSPPFLGPLFLRDGRTVIVGQQAPVIAIGVWDIVRRQRTALLEVRGAAPVSIALSPDSQSLAVGYADGSVRLWDAHTWTMTRVLRRHTRKVEALAFSPDGRFLATGSEDTTVRLWDTASGTEIVVLKGDAGGISAAAFSPDAQTLGAGSVDGVVTFWNLRTGREVTTLEAHGSVVSSLAFSPDGRTLATASVDETMRLWTAP